MITLADTYHTGPENEPPSEFRKQTRRLKFQGPKYVELILLRIGPDDIMSPSLGHQSGIAPRMTPTIGSVKTVSSQRPTIKLGEVALTNRGGSNIVRSFPADILQKKIL